MVYPSGYEVRYVYDTTGTLTHIKDADNINIWQLSQVNNLGGVKRSVIGSGGSFIKENEVNDLMMPSANRFTASINGNTWCNEWNYDFEETTGNMLSRQNELSQSGFGITTRNLSETFTYDNLDRLTSITPNAAATVVPVNYSYNGQGSIESKTEAWSTPVEYAYSYQTSSAPTGSFLPAHGVSQISPEIPGLAPVQSVTYTPFNKIDEITEGDENLNTNYTHLKYYYGIDNQRRKMTEETYENAALVLTRTKYYSGVFEHEITEANGVTTEREINFIFAPDGLAAIYEKKNGNMYYVSTDNLGSINIIADALGNIVNDLSYDAWGRRRDPYTWETLTVAQTKALQPTLITDRGYTLHEHMDAFGLINMNGRAYDPLVGQFLSPDPFVQSATSTQSYNRYSYCWNNPLKFVDPSGYANDLTWMDMQMRNYCWGTSYTNTDYGWVNTYWYNDFMDYVNSESDGFSTRNGKSGFWIDDSEWNYQLYKKTATFDQRWDNIAWGNKFSTFSLTSTFVSFEDAISKYILELEWEQIRGVILTEAIIITVVP